MTHRRTGSIRRLFADLRRAETRAAAMRRVHRRASAEVRGRTARSRAAAGVAMTGGDTAPALGRTRKPDAWYVGGWSGLAKAVLGLDDAVGSPAVDPAEAADAVRLARRHRGQSVLADAVAQGVPLDRAVCRAVDELTAGLEWSSAWALAEGVGRWPGGTTASALGHALFRHRRRHLDRVWAIVRDLDDDVLAREIPVEAVDAALAEGSTPARTRALAIGVVTDDMDTRVAVDLAGRFLVAGEVDRAAELVAALGRRSLADLDDRRRGALTLIEARLSRSPRSIPAGSVPFGVLDHRTPDPGQSSDGFGEDVQALAMLGNLARFSDVTFSGDDGFAEVAGELQRRVQPALRVSGVSGAVHLIGVDRDFSRIDDVPDGTWMVAFGWQTHAPFDQRADVSYHPNIRPLFISFHVNRVDALSPESLDYLRRYGPVGCRDWTTVFLLLSAGVDAFFSGCVTSTIDGVFPARASVYRGGGAVGVIDLPREAAGGARKVRVYDRPPDVHRFGSASDGLRAASETLARYQRDLDRAVTRRFDTYLPLTALGVPVDFKTPFPGDVEFAGLTGLHPADARIEQLRRGMRDRIAPMVERILGGASEREVYALWRELSADAVAEARRRFEAPAAAAPAMTIDVEAAVASARAGTRRFGPHESVGGMDVTDIVLAFDQNLLTPAAVLLESIVTNATGPVRLWVLGRGLSDAYQTWLAGAFPSLPMTFLPCDAITYGPKGRPRRVPLGVTISTMDRLLLPVLLGDVPRVVYLDVDTLVLDDICALARTELDDRPLAARDSNVNEASEWQRAARRIPEASATDLRRRMALVHGFGRAALNAGVLVLDLDRMRRDDFTASYLPWVEAYGFHDQDIMLAYAGPNRRVLDPRWNALPAVEDVRDPGIIHWASFGKPWDARLTFEQALWHEYARTLDDRAGPPPPDDAPVTSRP